MVVKTEGFHAGHFIVSEANKTRSRETIIIREGQVLVAGAIIAKGADGKYGAYNNDGTSDENTAAGILFDNVDATDGDVKAVGVLRDCEVNLDELQWADTEDTGDRDAAIADLAALGIIGRDENGE